jgi:hypothetical protein
MLILILFVVVIAVCATLLILDSTGVLYLDYALTDFVIPLVLVVSIIPTIVLCICGFSIAYAEDMKYESKIAEREMLIYRLENQNNDALLYEDIIEFNDWVRDNKLWAENLWTNIYNYQKCKTIEPINIP